MDNRLYTELRLNYRLRLWAATTASCTVSAVAELLVCIFAALSGPQEYAGSISWLDVIIGA